MMKIDPETEAFHDHVFHQSRERSWGWQRTEEGGVGLTNGRRKRSSKFLLSNTEKAELSCFLTTSNPVLQSTSTAMAGRHEWELLEPARQKYLALITAVTAAARDPTDATAAAVADAACLAALTYATHSRRAFHPGHAPPAAAAPHLSPIHI